MWREFKTIIENISTRTMVESLGVATKAYSPKVLFWLYSKKNKIGGIRIVVGARSVHTACAIIPD